MGTQIPIFRNGSGKMVIDIEDPVACVKQTLNERPIAVQGNIQNGDRGICQLCYLREKGNIPFDPGDYVGIGRGLSKTKLMERAYPVGITVENVVLHMFGIYVTAPE